MPRAQPRLPLAALALLAVLLLLVRPTAGITAQAQQIAEAHVVLMPDGRMPESRLVNLRHRWEKDYPGLGGKARYFLDLPAAADTGPIALLLEHSGNQLDVRINGQLLQRVGTPGDAQVDALKATHFILVPAALLRGDGSDLLEVEATIQAPRAAGLGRVRHGPPAAIAALYDEDSIWSRDLPRIYAVSLGLIGALSLALWLRQRDPLYGSFSLAALSGFVRVFDQNLVHPILPWPLWGAVVAACYSLHLCFVAHFVLLALGDPPHWLTRAIHTILLGVLALVAGSFYLAQPWLWSVGLFLLLLAGVASYLHVLHRLWRRPSPLARLLAAAGTGAIACGIHDLLQVRLGIGSGAYPLMPHAVFFFVLILAGILVGRYGRSIAAVHELNASLADRIAERERQLTEALTTLHQEREIQALAAERQRIMRELHDGIGSQLVGMLNLLDHPVTDQPVLAEHIQVALDEMRIAVDSLHPLDHDLTTLLANLRYRLQPRLTAAGLRVVWNVPQLPSHSQLTPQSALHLQRILLEAVTNTLKHARARSITLGAQIGGYPPAIRIGFEDDGVGWNDAASRQSGRGVANMRARATMIGAHLQIGPRPGGGTRIILEWPLSPPAASPSLLLDQPQAPCKAP